MLANVEQQRKYNQAGGNAKWYTPLKDRLAVFYKSKHIPTIRSRNHIPWYLPKSVESLCQDRNLHVDIYNSFSHRTKVNG